MLLKSDECWQHYRCPKSGNILIRTSDNKLSTTADKIYQYSILHDLPILVDFDLSILDENRVLASDGKSAISRPNGTKLPCIFRKLISPPSRKTAANIKLVMRLLKKGEKNPKLLIIGGGSIGQGLQPIYDDRSIKVMASDIYVSPNIQFISDAHQIPFTSGFFDCVIVQAVLEHVLQPNIVVSEIHRVLNPRGMVYAETPFLQHVHEGAYDFTRYTESGHRYLFRNFELINSGSIGSAGTQLLWSIDYFARSVFRSRIAGKCFRLLFFWIQHFDYLIPESYSIDSACGVFFLGRKTAKTISPSEIVTHYLGAQ